MANKFLPVLYNNIGKYVSKNLKSPLKLSERKPNTNFDTNLPSTNGSKSENVHIQNMPTIDLTPMKNVINVPMIVASLFNKRTQDIFKELLLIEPVKMPEIQVQPFNTTADFSEKGMTVSIEMRGFKEDDINVRIEGPWLVIEGQSSISVPEKEGGGLHVRHIIRRYEVPPNSDVSNIKSTFKNEILTVTIPNLEPKITKG